MRTFKTYQFALARKRVQIILFDIHVGAQSEPAPNQRTFNSSIITPQYLITGQR
jgi:hypothetical protein